MPQTIEDAFAKGRHPMIVVLPDSKTIYGGSMYSSSTTTGDFERFIAHDLVADIDAPLPDHSRLAEPAPGGPFHGRVCRCTESSTATASPTASPSIAAGTPAPSRRFQNRVLPFFSRSLCFEKCN